MSRPPCFEHAPLLVFDIVYVPSLHLPVAPCGAPVTTFLVPEVAFSVPSFTAEPAFFVVSTVALPACLTASPNWAIDGVLKPKTAVRHATEMSFLNMAGLH